MPYPDGKTPMRGDRVQHRFGQVGKVTRVQLDAANFPGHDIVGVEFEDGIAGIGMSLDEEWALIARASEEE